VATPQPAGYNRLMRRPTRYGLAALAALLVLIGGYSAYWLFVARQIGDGIGAWAQSAGDKEVDASWRAVGVTGFPLSFRVSLTDLVLRDRSVSPAPELRVGTLLANAAPWDLYDWRLGAPSGLAAELEGAGERPTLRLAAASAAGALALGSAGGGTLWLRLTDAGTEGGDAVRAAAAIVWIILPSRPAQRHTEPNFGVAADLYRVRLPVAARALGENLEQLAFGVTVKGALPGGNLVRSVASWRDAGGTIELDNLALKWGGLGATATGTLALDQDLQPIGGFSGAIEGYDQVLRALVEAGRMRPGDAGLAQLALTMLAKAGPDGRPQIATSFTIQNGQMFLGPARIGPAPRLAWK
jgi:hypothetical protein